MAPLPLPWTWPTHFSFGHILASPPNTLPMVWPIQPPPTPTFRDHSKTDSFPTHPVLPRVPPTPNPFFGSQLVVWLWLLLTLLAWSPTTPFTGPNQPNRRIHYLFHPMYFPTFRCLNLPPAWNACSRSLSGSFLYAPSQVPHMANAYQLGAVCECCFLCIGSFFLAFFFKS